MKRGYYIVLILLICCCVFGTNAQTAYTRISPYTGYYYANIDGARRMVINMKTVYIYPEKKFKSRKQEKHYWKTVRDVKKTLPYAKLVYSVLVETYEYIETLPDDGSREKHLKAMEDEVFKQYAPVLKKFTFSQGKMLILLINRECNQSSYALIRAFLGSFRAGFWQAIGGLFGVTLKTEWDPEGEHAEINRICLEVEQGFL